MKNEEFNISEFIAENKAQFTDKHLNKALIDNLPFPAMLIKKDRRVITINKIADEMGVKVGSFCWDTFGKKGSIPEQDKEYFEKNDTVPAEGIKCTFCKANEALASGNLFNIEVPAGEVTYNTFWVPISSDVYLHYAQTI